MKKARNDSEPEPLSWRDAAFRVVHCYGKAFLTQEERVPLNTNGLTAARETTTVLSNTNKATSTLAYYPAAPASRLISSLPQFTRLKRLVLVFTDSRDQYLPLGFKLPELLSDLCVDGNQCGLRGDFLARLAPCLHQLRHLRRLEFVCADEKDLALVGDLLKNSRVPIGIQTLAVSIVEENPYLTQMLADVLSAPCLPKLDTLQVRIDAYTGYGIEIPYAFLRAVTERHLTELQIVSPSRVTIPEDLDFFPPATTHMTFSGRVSYGDNASMVHRLLSSTTPHVKAWGVRVFVGVDAGDRVMRLSQDVNSQQWPMDYLSKELIAILMSAAAPRKLKCAVIDRLTRVDSLRLTTGEIETLHQTLRFVLDFARAAEDIVFAQTLVGSLSGLISRSYTPDILTWYDDIFAVSHYVIQRCGDHTTDAKPALRVISFVLTRMNVDLVQATTGRTIDEWVRLLLCKIGPTFDRNLARLVMRYNFLQVLEDTSGDTSGDPRLLRLALFHACQANSKVEDRLLRGHVPNLLLTPRTELMFPNVHQTWHSYSGEDSGFRAILCALAERVAELDQPQRYWTIVKSTQLVEVKYLHAVVDAAFTYKLPPPSATLCIDEDTVHVYLAEHLMSKPDAAEMHKYVVQVLVTWNDIYQTITSDIETLLRAAAYQYSKTDLKIRLRHACILYLLASHCPDLPTPWQPSQNANRLFDAFYQIVKQSKRRDANMVRLYLRGFTKLINTPVNTWPVRVRTVLSAANIVWKTA